MLDTALCSWQLTYASGGSAHTPVLPAQKASWRLVGPLLPLLESLLRAMSCTGSRTAALIPNTRTLRLRNGAPVCRVKATKRTSRTAGGCRNQVPTPPRCSVLRPLHPIAVYRDNLLYRGSMDFGSPPTTRCPFMLTAQEGLVVVATKCQPPPVSSDT